MAMPLHMGQRHNRHQIPDMKTRSGRVKADVTGNLSFQYLGDLFFIRDLFNKAPFLKNIINSLLIVSRVSP